MKLWIAHYWPTKTSELLCHLLTLVIHILIVRDISCHSVLVEFILQIILLCGHFVRPNFTSFEICLFQLFRETWSSSIMWIAIIHCLTTIGHAHLHLLQWYFTLWYSILMKMTINNLHSTLFLIHTTNGVILLLIDESILSSIPRILNFI